MSGNCPVISHVFFADDSLFFLKAKASECDCLIGLIDQYCKASGQSINFSKSEVTFSPNTPMDEQQYFCNRIGVKRMDPHTRYLGLPSIHGRNKGGLFLFILDKVLKKCKDENKGFYRKLDVGSFDQISYPGRSLRMPCNVICLPKGFLSKTFVT
ncbi:hypothetical protein Tco_0340874 [Tanacetum coccineum]